MEEGPLFSELELGILSRTINRTWDTIASDLFSAIGVAEIDRYEVAETCLDADRWRENTQDKEAMEIIIEKLRKLGFYSAKWKAVIRKVLPYKTYGN